MLPLERRQGETISSSMARAESSPARHRQERHPAPGYERVATILLDAGMPLDQVQKFLRHKRITTTHIYAETSLHAMDENYVRATLPKFGPSLG
jgi:site-specific recombinase XerC